MDEILDNMESPELVMLRNNKEGGYNYRERRHEQWRENYTLYRDTVTINRLTQRQSVNVPLMKQAVRTLLKDVDDMPVLYFENLDNDKQAELYKNEYWQKMVELNNMEVLDIVDKKQVFLFGRSFDQWQIVDGRVKMTIQDPQDILIDRYVDPTDLDSARFLIHQHIYMPLSALEQNENYDQDKVAQLKQWYESEEGLVKQEDNQEAFVEKQAKMSDMGVEDVYDPVVGEVIFELSMHFVRRKEEDEEEEQIYVYVEAEGMQILMKEKLEDIIGTTKDHFWRHHYPYVTWADDVERQDFWSDGVGDIIRQPNKIVNAWLSQLVENRTLRNFGMNYYDSTIEGFTPGSFEPIPWGWYGVPGNPKDVVHKIDIPDLSESLDEMQFVVNFVERATGATSTQQGDITDRNITLGEVQLALGEAKERVKGMSKFYTPAWKRRGLLFEKLVEAGADKLDPVKISKKGRNSDDMYTRMIAPKDWVSKEGYSCKVWSQEEKNTHDTDSLQKISLLRTNLPGNAKVDEIYKRKLAEFADLTPQQINEIMDAERQLAEQAQTLPEATGGAQTPAIPLGVNQAQPVQQPA